MSLVNRLDLLKNYLLQNESISGGPSDVGIEITNYCNLDCNMCNRKEMIRPFGNINWKTFRKIVDETYLTAEIYLLFGLGEPLLHPLLPRMIDYCHRKGASVILSTNAIVLNRQMTKKLLNHPPDYLIFAIDATNPQTYLKIKGRNHFRRVQKNVLYFLKEWKKIKNPTTTIAQLVKQDLNKRESKIFKNYWQKKKISGVYIKPVIQVTNLKKLNPNVKRCLYPWQRVTFTWQGEASPCCLDTNCGFNLGNINRSSFAEIWNSSNWQELRNSFKKGKLKPLCRLCTVYRPSLPTAVAKSLLNEMTVKKTVPVFIKFRRLL